MSIGNTRLARPAASARTDVNLGAVNYASGQVGDYSAANPYAQGGPGTGYVDPRLEGRDPRDDLNGNLFPAASQAVNPRTGVIYGDAGDGEHPFDAPMSRRVQLDAGRDLVADGGPRAQGDEAFFGMDGSYSEYRNRFEVALDEPSAAGRPIFAPRDFAMRPSATAVPIRTFGEPPGVQSRRMVAPGRVTRWSQTSLVWPELGPRTGAT